MKFPLTTPSFSPWLGVIAACMALPGQLAAQENQVDLEARLQTLTRARNTQINAADFAGALASAEELVARLEGTGDERFVDHLITLADVQTRLGELEEAEANYLRSLELLEERDGELALSLVRPHQGLARSYVDGGRYQEAITLLEHARDLTQRSLGLFNLEQAALLDDMTRAYLAAGDTVQARGAQQDRLNMALRRFGPDSPEVIPFRSRLGEYYELSRLRSAAREQYEEILIIQEAASGGADGSLLLPLGQLVRLDLLSRERSPARERMIQILASDVEISSVDRARSLVVLGDWELVEENTGPALAYYKEAYDLLREAGLDPEEQFDKPMPINFIAPLGPVDLRRRRSPHAWGSITLSFGVSPEGRPADVQVASAQPAQYMEPLYIGRIRETTFRPRLVDGEAVSTANVRFSHQFRFYVQEPEDD